MQWRCLIPHGLTATRFASAPLYFVGFFCEWNPVAIFLFAAAVAATDILDGFTARALRCESDFGKRFDPLADMIFCFGVVAGVLYHSGINAYAACVYWFPLTIGIGYSILIVRMRLRKEICAANWSAKCAMFAVMTGGGGILARIAFDLFILEVAGVTGIALGVFYQIRAFREYRKST